MSAMEMMQMPGGWTMSHMWMLMPGQTWLGATMSFVGMWTAMMAAMMLPSLIPSLVCYRESVTGTRAAHLVVLTALVAGGYLAVWTALGVVVFPIGMVIAEVAMREPQVSRQVPIATGLVVVLAGIVQHSSWKARRLAACRARLIDHLTPNAWAALQHGLRVGVRCVQSCAGLTTIALALGLMSLPVMAIVTAAITLERLVPDGVRVARQIGVVGIATGVFLVVRAVA